MSIGGREGDEGCKGEGGKGNALRKGFVVGGEASGGKTPD